MENRVLEMMLTRIVDRAGYVLVVGRGGGKTLLLGTCNAGNRLVAINAASPLEHEVRVFRTEHYAAIVQSLRERFRSVAEDGFGLWFDVDACEIVAAVEECAIGSDRWPRTGSASDSVSLKPHSRVGTA